MKTQSTLDLPNRNSFGVHSPSKHPGLAGLVTALAVFAGVQAATAANIVWVTDATDPTLGFGQTAPTHTDYRFVTMLQNAGHNVITFNSANASATLLTQAQIDALNTNDLIIAGRCVNSSTFQAGQGGQWNTNITKPLITQSAYHIRNNRLGWFVGASVPDNTPTILGAGLTGNPATDAVVDYLFAGVAMNGTNTALPYDEPMDRNTSQTSDAPVAGGIIYAAATFVTEGNTAVPPNPPTTANGNIIVGFPAGTAVTGAGGTDILAGYRMYFASGSREAATAPNTVNLYAGRENLTPTGEDIFLRAVQVALNNGAAPATDPLAPVGFTSHPMSATVLQGGSVTFSASVTGAAPRTVQWQRDTGDGMTFTNIPDASTPFLNSTYTLTGLTPADSGARFRAVANNLAVNNATSEVATLTVTADTAPPVPLSAASLDGMTVGICFDELLDNRPDFNTATDTINYQIDGGAGPGVTAAALQPDGRSVLLTLGGPVGPTFSVGISFVEDRFGNAMDTVEVSGVNFGFTAAAVGAQNPAGSVFACDGSSMQISGGGSDLTSMSDSLQFAYKIVEGDFDARVRVLSLVGVPDHIESTTKAILTARETTDAGSAAVNVFVTPTPPGNDWASANYRATTGAATNSFGTTFVPTGLPGNAWMRITRAGDVFTTYRSLDGTTWTAFGSAPIVLPASLRVGVGVVSHRNGKLATGTFTDFSISQGPAQPTITDLSYMGGSFSGSFQTQNGFSYEVQFKNNLNETMWQTLTTIAGDGTVKTFTDPGPAGASRFYQIVAQ